MHDRKNRTVSCPYTFGPEDCPGAFDAALAARDAARKAAFAPRQPGESVADYCARYDRAFCYACPYCDRPGYVSFAPDDDTGEVVVRPADYVLPD